MGADPRIDQIWPKDYNLILSKEFIRLKEVHDLIDPYIEKLNRKEFLKNTYQHLKQIWINTRDSVMFKQVLNEALANGFDLDYFPDDNGLPLLYEIIKSGVYDDMALELIELGANVNIKDENSRNLLMLKCYEFVSLDFKLINTLIEKTEPDEIGIKDCDGRTIVDYLCYIYCVFGNVPEKKQAIFSCIRKLLCLGVEIGGEDKWKNRFKYMDDEKKQYIPELKTLLSNCLEEKENLDNEDTIPEWDYAL